MILALLDSTCRPAHAPPSPPTPPIPTWWQTLLTPRGSKPGTPTGASGSLSKSGSMTAMMPSSSNSQSNLIRAAVASATAVS